MRKLLLLSLCLLYFQILEAKVKQVHAYNQTWVGFYNQTRLSNKWGFWADVQLRTNDAFIENILQNACRVGLTYYSNENLRVTAGYAYFNNLSPANGANVALHEHRAWQQVAYNINKPNARILQTLRLEERFRQRLLNADMASNSYAFNYRIRYAYNIELPLSKNKFEPHAVTFFANEEMMLNFGKQIIYNTFDQNRIYVGLNYRLSKLNNIRLGYMNVFQQQNSGQEYRNTNAVRLIFLSNVDLRKSK